MMLPRPKQTLREYLAVYGKEHTKFGTKLTHMVGIPMIVFSVPTVFVNPPAAGAMFVGGWALQFIGHYVFEHNNPSFYSDPYYLLAGPVWVAAEWMQLIGLDVPEAMRPTDFAVVDGADAANGRGAVSVSH